MKWSLTLVLLQSSGLPADTNSHHVANKHLKCSHSSKEWDAHCSFSFSFPFFIFYLPCIFVALTCELTGECQSLQRHFRVSVSVRRFQCDGLQLAQVHSGTLSLLSVCTFCLWMCTWWLQYTRICMIRKAGIYCALYVFSHYTITWTINNSAYIFSF